MKKILILGLLFFNCIYCIFAYGARDQSQALLFKQTRVNWENAPNDAVFYEVYLLRNGDDIRLLDTYIYRNILFVNFLSSMYIKVTNASEILLQEDNIYKCVVLYSGVILGMAIVNIFDSNIITGDIGYIGFYEDYSMILSLYQDNYFKKNNIILVYLPHSRRSILQIDKWPPTNFQVIDVLDILNNIRENYEVEKMQINSNDEILSVSDYINRIYSELMDMNLINFER